MVKTNKWYIDLLHFAIFLVFLFTPIESVGVFGADSSFSVVKLSFLFLIAVWFLFSRKLDNNIFIKYYIAYFAYFFIGVLWSINIDASFRQLVLFLLPTVLMCSIISKNLRTQEDFRLIAVGYLIGCAIMSGFAFSMRDQILYDAKWGDMERVTALGQDANELAFLICIGIGILLHNLGSESKKMIKIASWAVVAFWSYVILSTGSRTGMVILASLFFVFFMNNKKSLPYLLPLIFLAFFYLLQFVSEGTLERLLETSSSVQSRDLTGRGEIWHWGWTAFLEENIILGVGYDNFSYLLTKHGHVARASHNTYISNLICAGFLGFFIFLGILIQIIDLVVKTHKIEKKWNLLYYVFPLFLAMITLEISTRRWLFLLCVVMYNYYLLVKNKHNQQEVVSNKSEN